MGFVARHKVAVIVLFLVATFLLLSGASVMLISPGDSRRLTAA
jgi:hypothetical protein